MATQAGRKWKQYNAIQNEGGEGFNPHSEALCQAEHADYAQQLAAVETRMAHAQAIEDAEWTAEVTTARRAAWNTWATAQRGPVTPKAVMAQEKKQGWTMATLKRQITRHGL